MAFTNQQVLDKLLEIRDTFLLTGMLMQRSISTSNSNGGSAIEYRSFEDIEKLIQLYQAKVDAENASFNPRGYLYA